MPTRSSIPSPPAPSPKCPTPPRHDLEEALAAADRAWPEWRSTDVEKRGAILHKAASLLRERADHIGAILTQEQGKILAEAKAEVLGSARSCSIGTPRRSSATMAARWSARRASCRA